MSRHTVLAEEDNVLNLETEELRHVMEELVSYDKPDREKSALVRKLKADALKDDPTLVHQKQYASSSPFHTVAVSSATGTSSSGKTGRNSSADHQQQSGCRRNGTRNRSSRSEMVLPVTSATGTQNSQSLQDLASIDDGISSNSLDQSSNANPLKERQQHHQHEERMSSDAAAATSATSAKVKVKSVTGCSSPHCITSATSSIASSSSQAVGSDKTACTCNKMYASASSATSSHQSMATSSASQDHRSSSPVSSSNPTNRSANNNNDCDVENGPSDSGSRSNTFTPGLKTYSHTCHSNSSSNSKDIVELSRPNVTVCRSDHVIEGLEGAIEMHDLRKKADLVNYSDLNGSRSVNTASSHDVDSGLRFANLESHDPMEQQFNERRYNRVFGSNGEQLCLIVPQCNDYLHNLGLRPVSDRSVTSLPDSDLNRSATAPGSLTCNRKLLKKRTNKETKVIAGELPGNIGDKDVDYLTHYVLGQDASRSSNTNANSRRDRKSVPSERSKENNNNSNSNNKKKKTPERSNSQPERGSSEEKIPEKMPKGRSTSPLDHRPSSPSHATSVSSYAPDEYVLRDEFSDEEKGYHTDQDSGFQVMKGKRRYNRHNRMSRLPAEQQQNHLSSHHHQQQQHHTQHHHHQPQQQQPPPQQPCSRPQVNTAATLSSPTNSSSPSFSTAAFSVCGTSASVPGSASLTSRGYESEKEFYPENYSRRQSSFVHRRKTASSMPHSERNSPENSDVDSSLSLPIVHRMPPPPAPPAPVAPVVTFNEQTSGKMSYAQMARSASASVPSAPLLTSVPLLSSHASSSTSSSTSAMLPRNNNSINKSNVSNSTAILAVTGKNGNNNGKQGPVKNVSPKSNVVPENQSAKAGTGGHELKNTMTPAAKSSTSATVSVSAATAVVSSPESAPSVKQVANTSSTDHCVSSSDTVMQTKSHSLPPQSSPPSSTSDADAESTVSSDDRHLIRKHNSIPETTFKSMMKTKILNRSLDSARPSQQLPAVIMCDDSVTSVTDNSLNGSSSATAAVTFGFFDDLTENNSMPVQTNVAATKAVKEETPVVVTNAVSSERKDTTTVSDGDVKSSGITNCTPHINNTTNNRKIELSGKLSLPEAQRNYCRNNNSSSSNSLKSSKKSGAQSIAYPADVDVETFNYNEILAYIRKAWENVIRAEKTACAHSFSTSSSTTTNTTPEKTSLA